MERVRVVLDTNVLFGSAWSRASASRRVVDACAAGDLVAVLSPPLRREYDYILTRTARSREYYESLKALLERAEVVEPARTPRVVPDDPDDDKLVAVALAGGAAVILTNDEHLLRLDPYGPLRIQTPAAFLAAREGPAPRGRARRSGGSGGPGTGT